MGRNTGGRSPTPTATPPSTTRWAATPDGR